MGSLSPKTRISLYPVVSPRTPGRHRHTSQLNRDFLVPHDQQARLTRARSLSTRTGNSPQSRSLISRYRRAWRVKKRPPRRIWTVSSRNPLSTSCMVDSALAADAPDLRIPVPGPLHVGTPAQNRMANSVPGLSTRSVQRLPVTPATLPPVRPGHLPGLIPAANVGLGAPLAVDYIYTCT